MIVDFKKFKDYIELEEPIELETFSIVGYFPYATAIVRPEDLRNLNAMPRAVAGVIEDKISFGDNKTVIICKDKYNLGTNSFAVNLKDDRCVFGTYEEVTAYSGYPLKLKD